MPSHDPHSHADLTQARIRHLDLHIEVDFAANRLRIVAEYLLDRPATGPLDLDSRDLDIASIEAGGRRIEFEMGEPEVVLGQRVRLLDLGGADRFTLSVTTSPHASALQWLEAHHTASGRHPFVYSQCQPLHARSLFPCQDTPSVRFTYAARLTVPKGLTAAMAAACTGREAHRDLEVFRFEMPQAIPSYLFALAVGDLAFRQLGPRTGVYAEPPLLEAAAWEFAENESRLAAAEALFGPYAWDRYDLLVMPPSFPSNGMENPRLTFVTPLAILGDRSRMALIAHELAHAWTGNLVTNATWDDFWLNEGWTTYADHRITEALEGPEVAGLLQAVLLDVLREDIRAFGPDSPHTCLKTSLAGIDPDAVFSRVPYMKGQLFLLSLEQAVGRLRFDAFLREYIRRFRFQSLTTEDFLAFLERELPEAAQAVDVQAWVYRPGLPERLPAMRSALYDEVVRRRRDFEAGALPSSAEAAAWHPYQRILFLRLLPPTISIDDCGRIEASLGLRTTKRTLELYEFLRLATRSGYAQVWPMMEAFAERVGNEYQLKRVFRSLAEAEWSRPLTRPLFERVRHRHHPITEGLVDQLLRELGV
ncbi:MAG: M1 family metallopeptidase [Chloroflexi bacterium]|nr:M1 family metallopeptidase [Chloroflexota bacterium]